MHADSNIFSSYPGPAELVRLLRFWLDKFFSQAKNNIPFLQKASNKQSASVILGLIRLIISHAFRLLLRLQGTLSCKS